MGLSLYGPSIPFYPFALYFSLSSENIISSSADPEVVPFFFSGVPPVNSEISSNIKDRAREAFPSHIEICNKTDFFYAVPIRLSHRTRHLSLVPDTPVCCSFPPLR